ncbi:MAG: amidohydrolase family protein, partial [Thermomicrobiales bacterium]|nr:amidohydrolase family protein [Thermomicrobiales bacterium]
MFTIHGAYASFEESIKGSITEGKLADLTVLSADPRTVAPEDLHTLRADLTMIDGRVVFES